MTFSEWLFQRTECNPDILCGTRVFEGSRLAVENIVWRLTQGVKITSMDKENGVITFEKVTDSAEQIKEDYDYLTDEDIHWCSSDEMREYIQKWEMLR